MFTSPPALFSLQPLAFDFIEPRAASEARASTSSPQRSLRTASMTLSLSLLLLLLLSVCLLSVCPQLTEVNVESNRCWQPCQPERPSPTSHLLLMMMQMVPTDRSRPVRGQGTGQGTDQGTGQGTFEKPCSRNRQSCRPRRQCRPPVGLVPCWWWWQWPCCWWCRVRRWCGHMPGFLPWKDLLPSSSRFLCMMAWIVSSRASSVSISTPLVIFRSSQSIVLFFTGRESTSRGQTIMFISPPTIKNDSL